MKKTAFSGIVLALLLVGMLLRGLSLTDADLDELQSRGIEFVRKEIIVKLKSGVSLSPKSSVLTGIYSIDQLNKQFGVVRMEKIFVANHSSLSNWYKLKFSNDVNIPSAIKEYLADPNVEYAEPNYIGHAALTPNDADYALQWAHPKMYSELAWNIQTGDPNVVIAVIDTGVDWNHPDLATNIWVNTNEILDGNDTDGNGYIDDIRGWDFVDTTDPVWPGEDGTVRDNDPMDFQGHGTHVAGIAAAATNNTIGVAGMSWKSKIMALRAGYMNSTGFGRFQWVDVVPAIEYAADNGAKIISMSIGGYGFSSLFKSAVDYAYAKGVFLVAAAGNENVETKLYPAGYENVTAVAATNSSDGKASFSNYGSWVDVSAPGVNIRSTVFNDTYGYMSGTSMSTPYVAGLAGLILSENPTSTNVRVRNLIRNAIDPTTSSVYIGTGRVNAYKALLGSMPPVFILKWGSYGSGNGQFNYPQGVAVDGSGDIYVVDTSNDRVQKFTSSGGYITQWGSSGGGDGQFRSPRGVAVDGSGNVYVADSNNHRVQKFGPEYTLTITATAGGTTNPSTGSYTYAAGTVVDVSATPDPNYYFDYWELDGSNVGATNPISVTMDQDHSLLGVFVYAPPAVPEFPIGLALEILFIPVIIYVLWRSRQRKMTKLKDINIKQDEANT